VGLKLIIDQLLEVLKYIFLGIIQGITEVLPISSSGHVAIAQFLLKIDTDGGFLFFIVVNLGSLVAIIYHFRRFIKKLIVNSFIFIFSQKTRAQTSEDFFYVIKIIIAIIPFGIAGLFLENSVNELYEAYSLFVVAIGLLITSTFLYIIRFAPNKNVKQTISFTDAFVIGLLQPFAMIPGLSRSGITTSTGLYRKISMDTALTFSLMLYIPISIGAFIYKFGQLVINPSSVQIVFDTTNIFQYCNYFFAFVFSLLATIFSLKYIFKWFRQGKLVYFAAYTMILGIIALIGAILTF
jgi:undecaprenyl-diphosphatase